LVGARKCRILVGSAKKLLGFNFIELMLMQVPLLNSAQK